jgi:putative transposase
MRHDVMPCDKDIQEGDPLFWQKDVPYDTRDLAIKDALIGIKGCLTKLRNGQIDHFEMKYRTKKYGCQSFKVNPAALLDTSVIFKHRLGNRKLRVRKKDLKEYLNDGNIAEQEFTILKTNKSNKWYICLPRKPKDLPVIQTPAYKLAFLDPGVRTFQTFYSPEGICGKIGSPEFSQKLATLAARHDKLMGVAQSTENKVSSKTKRHLLQRCAKLRDQIKNKVNDLHWQTCNFLCTTFESIFLPEFNVADMVQGSPLGSKITRKMLQLSHGAFRERLKYYAKKHNNHLYIVKEAYTTKTCGVCGNLQDMNGLKVYNCSHCNNTIDRDYNGARNICLKMVGYAQ